MSVWQGDSCQNAAWEKCSFADLADRDGKIQLFIKRDMLGEEAYAMVKKYDIGDIVGAEGEVFKTKTGEVSVKVKDIMLLSKSLLAAAGEVSRPDGSGFALPSALC